MMATISSMSHGTLEVYDILHCYDVHVVLYVSVVHDLSECPGCPQFPGCPIDVYFVLGIQNVNI
jgi:hypothetical protein